MKYFLSLIYGYLSCVAGVLISSLIIYLVFGFTYFEFLGGILGITLAAFIVGLIDYLIGLIFLWFLSIFGKKIDIIQPLFHFIVWAFFSGFISAIIPGISFNLEHGLAFLEEGIWSSFLVLIPTIIFITLKKYHLSTSKDS